MNAIATQLGVYILFRGSEHEGVWPVGEKKRPSPTFKMILTTGEGSYTNREGIHIVPLACLKD